MKNLKTLVWFCPSLFFHISFVLSSALFRKIKAVAPYLFLYLLVLMLMVEPDSLNIYLKWKNFGLLTAARLFRAVVSISLVHFLKKTLLLICSCRVSAHAHASTNYHNSIFARHMCTPGQVWVASCEHFPEMDQCQVSPTCSTAWVWLVDVLSISR